MTDKKLAQKIAEASIAVGKFAADKRNKEQGYDYISADQVLAKAGDAIARAGFAVMPGISDVVLTFTERQGKSPRIDARVEFIMRLTDGETDIQDAWIGYGSDYSVPDKAVYKAITSGHKYYLMKLLNIGAGNDDSDHDEPEPVRRMPVTQPAPVQAPAVNGDAKLIEARRRYDLLSEEAAKHNITSEPSEAFDTYEELVAAGKGLRKVLDNALKLEAA